MMIRKRLYITRGYGSYRSKIYGRGGVEKEFIVASSTSQDFFELLDVLDKPLYCLHPKYPLTNSEIIDMNKLICVDNSVVLIPLLAGNDKAAVFTTKLKEAIRSDVIIDKAMLYSKDDPTGYVSPLLLENGLQLLKEGYGNVNTGMFACERELSSAVWKRRNDIRVIQYSRARKIITRRSKNGKRRKEA